MRPKVIGVGLNKTATKSLSYCFETLGYSNHSFSLDAFKLYQQRDWQALFTIMDRHTSFEDWPWPLMYREIHQQYPDAKFILTTRATPEIWYRSLCKMAVRMGPLDEFEKHIYGYSMPQGHKREHLEFYEIHNASVINYFSDKPGKLMQVCFDTGIDIGKLCEFLELPNSEFDLPHENVSAPVYSGDSRWRAEIARICFKVRWHSKQGLGSLKRLVAPIRNRLR